jgi:hypothetical protein
MKSKYLFKGKRIDNGEWVEGLLLTNKLGTYIVYEENPHECTQYGYIEINEYARVDPETVVIVCPRCNNGYTCPISGGERRCVKCKGAGVLN